VSQFGFTQSEQRSRERRAYYFTPGYSASQRTLREIFLKLAPAGEGRKHRTEKLSFSEFYLSVENDKIFFNAENFSENPF
jgi:hypothetical protein